MSRTDNVDPVDPAEFLVHAAAACKGTGGGFVDLVLSRIVQVYNDRL